MFVQSVMIRKNNLELKRKLRDLGYDSSGIVGGEYLATSVLTKHYSSISKEQWNSTNPHVTWNTGRRIDCGTNEKLFLAIAALNTSNDYMQWFMFPKEQNLLSSDFIFRVDKHMSVEQYVRKYYRKDLKRCNAYHKLTLEELISKFNK